VSADIITFPNTSKPKALSARDRMEALLAAQRNQSVVAEFPNLQPGVRTLLEQNAALFMRIAE
jgi:hypothetical protein